MEAQDGSQPDRHIRISGKIKIDLERKSSNSKPCHQDTHLTFFQR